jgi:hypothetical protein
MKSGKKLQVDCEKNDVKELCNPVIFTDLWTARYTTLGNRFVDEQHPTWQWLNHPLVEADWIGAKLGSHKLKTVKEKSSMQFRKK